MRMAGVTCRALLCAAALVAAAPFPAAGASSRFGIQAAYETDPGDPSGRERGDTWAGLTVGRTLARETGGPLTLSLDFSIGATAYARLTDLDRVGFEVSPAIDYVLSPRVAATLALVAEGRLVKDDQQNAWGWGGSLRLREQLSPGVDLAEYLSCRGLQASDERYSGTSAAAGILLRFMPASRWTLEAGGEYARGDFFGGEAHGRDAIGAGRGSGRLPGRQPDGAPASTSWASGSVAAEYAWSAGLSSGVGYLVTRELGAGGGDQHTVSLSTTLRF